MLIELTRKQFDNLWRYLAEHRQTRIINIVADGHKKRNGKLQQYVVVSVARYHSQTVRNFQR